MGAIDITRIGQGWSMDDAFRAVQEDQEENGSDIYGGGINLCKLGRTYHSREEFDKQVEQGLDKRDAIGICIRKPVLNTLKVKTVVTRNPQKGTRVWRTEYAVLRITFIDVEQVRETFTKQDEAIAYARQLVGRTKIPHEVVITKQLLSGVGTIAKIEYKKDKKERIGSYEFAACAPY